LFPLNYSTIYSFYFFENALLPNQKATTAENKPAVSSSQSLGIESTKPMPDLIYAIKAHILIVTNRAKNIYVTTGRTDDLIDSINDPPFSEAS